MDGEKATDGGLERGSHPLFVAVIAVGEGDIMAITGIGRIHADGVQFRLTEPADPGLLLQIREKALFIIIS